jgi:hypothetical protein
MKYSRIYVVAGLMLGLAACGRDRAPEESAVSAPPAATSDSSTTPDAAPAADSTQDTQVQVAVPAPESLPKVSAKDLVAQAGKPGRPGAPIEFKYQLAGAPQVGQPLVIDFGLVPQAASPAVHLMVATSGGLTLGQSNAPAVLRNVAAGSEYWHELVVTPQQTGVFSVNLIATVGEGEQMLARTFSIPVIVGSTSMDSAKARKLNTEVDATGQAIEVMPGQERR